MRWLPLPVLLLGALLAWGLASGRPAVPESRPVVALPRVQVVEARPRDVRVAIRTHGTVEPRTEIDLVIEVAGRVRSISPALAAGGRFEAGEPLVELDPGDARLALERAQAVLERRGSEARLAAARLVRRRELERKDVASPAQLEESEHSQRIAAAAVREARAVRDQARRDLERTRVLAPFAGRVRAKLVDVGQFVARGTPAARIYATDVAEVRLPIPSSELRFLDLSRERDGERPGVLLQADYAGRKAEWRGHLVRTEGEISPRSRMLYVVAEVEDPDAPGGSTPPLTVGLFVEAEIEGRRFEEVTVLPAAALRGDSEVLVVDGEGLLRPRRVGVLRLQGGQLLVASGLAPGEQVCVSTLATAGTRVRAVPGEETSAVAASAVFP